MILDLPGFYKITSQIPFDLIQYVLMKKKIKKPITNQPVSFLIEGSYHQRNSLCFLKM